jgi:hypothetical protein
MANDSELKIQLDGKTYAIEDFELGELEWLEDELGGPLDEVSLSSMKAAVRFVTVIKRRDNPDFTVEDARKLTLRAFEADDDPPANGNGAPKRPTRRAKPKGSGASASS